MFKIGDKVVYKRNVCIINDIKENKFTEKECYELTPIDDDSLKIIVPLKLENTMRNVISKKEIEEIIKSIPHLEVISNMNEKNIENEYKKCLDNLTHENLIRVIKTTYLRNKMRTDSKKKISDKDDMYFKMAEKLLYTEFSVSLNMSYDDTKEYVVSNVLKQEGD
ncbi:MAG: CarD family transcriptional regulator [Bacilli bacterium]|nr:CarD family transcriptional regulator [Bacilli bacterium]